MAERDLLGLVELCYASVAQPEAWPDFLAACERAFEAISSSVATFAFDPLRMTWSAMHGFSDVERARIEQWAAHDPRAELTQRLVGPGEAYSFDASHDIEGFKRSDYYINAQRETGILWSAIGRLGEGRGLDGVWSLHRPERMPSFDAGATREVAVLARHIGRARRLQLDLELARAETALRHDLLDRLPLGLLLLAADGKVLELNRAASTMVAAGDGLGLRASLLHAEDKAAQRQLAAMIHAAGKGLLDGVGGVVAVPRPSGEAAYIVSVARCFSELSQALGLRAAVIVSIADPARRPGLGADTLRQLWSLTAAEAQVALALARGLGLREIAARDGISYETVRVHLKRALAKSGTHRQAELVGLIHRGIGALVADK